LNSAREELKIADIKMAGIHEFEIGLRSKLEARAREQVRQEYETALLLAEERVKARDAEREENSRKLEDLSSEMKRIEAFYINQAKNRERYVHVCAVSCHVI